MNPRRLRWAQRALVVLMPLAAASAPAAPAKAPSPSPAPQPNAAILSGLEFRSIGPAIMGGRVDDFAVIESRPATFYVATASGGVFVRTHSNASRYDCICGE